MIVGTVRRVAAMAASTLVVGTLLASPTRADSEPCAPMGPNSATSPRILPAPGGLPYESRYTTDDVQPLAAIDIETLGLNTPRTLNVASQHDGAPGTCIVPPDRWSGFDNELLRVVAAHFGLRINFHDAKLADIITGVQNGTFDLGSGSITATDTRRELVDFTNGYDFGYNTLVVPSNSPITGFDDLPGRRCPRRDQPVSGPRPGTMSLRLKVIGCSSCA